MLTFYNERNKKATYFRPLISAYFVKNGKNNKNLQRPKPAGTVFAGGMQLQEAAQKHNEQNV